MIIQMFLALYRDRGFGFNTDGRHHDFKVACTVFFQSLEGFVFPGNQDITHATLNEGGGGTAGTGIQYR